MATARPSLRTIANDTHASRTAVERGPFRVLRLVWADWRVAATLAMPRGPDTSTQALGLLVVGLAVGVLAGLVLGSRWAMLLAPVATPAAFELGRRSTDGPLIDGTGTRLVVRVRADYAPRWLRPLTAVLLTPIHALMERAMLRGIKRRAERVTRAPTVLVATTST